MVEYTDEDLTGSRFLRVDLSGSRFHGPMLRNVTITDAWIDNVDISAHVGRLTVNGIDVSGFVDEELLRRNPELRLLRAPDVETLREGWAMIGERAAATVQKARALPVAALDESVNDEFSFIQTLRHLVMATDRWLTGPVFGDPDPFHPLGYPHDNPEWGRTIGLDIDARPPLDEVLDLRHERLARVADLLRDASQDDLERTVESPNGGTTTVRGCVHVVMNEEWWHDGYANRDLDVLAGGGQPQG